MSSKTPQAKIDYTTQWRKENPDAVRRYGVAFRAKARAELLEAYGGECRCCGTRTPEFLAIDHIDGGGAEHRRLLRSMGTNTNSWLRNNGYPQEGFQILCHNCNFAKSKYGGCPHV